MGISERSPEALIARRCTAGRLRLVARSLTALYDEALRPHGLTLAQLNVLVALAVRSRARATEIARELQLERSTLSRGLTRLRRRGWVERAGSGTAVRVTARGRALLLSVLPAWEAAEREARERLGAGAVLEIARMAARLRDCGLQAGPGES